MLIKDLQNNNTEILNCMLEVLANSMKSELDHLLKMNYEEGSMNTNHSFSRMSLNLQRKQLILYLLNIKDVNELSHYSEHFVSIFEYKFFLVKKNFQNYFSFYRITYLVWTKIMIKL